MVLQALDREAQGAKTSLGADLEHVYCRHIIRIAPPGSRDVQGMT